MSRLSGSKVVVSTLVLATVLLAPRTTALPWGRAHPSGTWDGVGGGGQRLLQADVVSFSRADELADQVKQSPGLAAALKPGYHVTTPASGGWMNDPNAPLHYKGVYHLFYQYNPMAPVWGAPYWAHVVSSDLMHWKHLPPAIIPDASYDADGVFSGSATILADGTPAILYTGVARFAELGFYYQTQALAVPANTSDAMLTRWVKRPFPVIPDAPPGGNHAQWRDPTTAWDLDGMPVEAHTPINTTAEGIKSYNVTSYFAAVGAQLECQGGAALYEAGPSFDDWQYRGVLFSIAALTNGSSKDTCPSPEDSDGSGIGGELDGEDLVTCPSSSQYSASCPMWECPDWFMLADSQGQRDGISVFKYSDQVQERIPFGQDWYVLSDVPLNFASVARGGGRNSSTAGPSQHGSYAEVADDGAGQPAVDESQHPNELLEMPSLSRDGSGAAADGALFSNQVGGETYSPLLFDHGAVYASKTFRAADGRQLWWGWVYETAQGCYEMCAPGTLFTEALGWQGAQTLPRVIEYDSASRSLLLNPAREVETLREALLYDRDLPFGQGAGTDRQHVLLPAGYGLGSFMQKDGRSDGAERREDQMYGSGSDEDGDQPMRQFELLALFNLTAPGSGGGIGSKESAGPLPFSLGATIDHSGSQRTVITITGIAELPSQAEGGAGPSGATPSEDGGPKVEEESMQMLVREADIWVDTTRSGGATQGRRWGGPVPLPEGGLPAINLQLRVFVDRSLIEVYGLGGRQRTTARVYPLQEHTSWGASLFANVGGAAAGGGGANAHAEVWRLGPGWIQDLLVH